MIWKSGSHAWGTNGERVRVGMLFTNRPDHQFGVGSATEAHRYRVLHLYGRNICSPDVPYVGTAKRLGAVAKAELTELAKLPSSCGVAAAPKLPRLICSCQTRDPKCPALVKKELELI